MIISIAERFRPFMHVPGELWLLPLSNLSFQIFPALIRVYDLSSALPILKAEFPVEIKGPVSKFTALQDLEKGYLKIWGESKQGYFRYRIQKAQSELGFTCQIEKFPTKEPLIPLSFCQENPSVEMPKIARLSFGVTKAQDLSLINRRMLLAEILPIWFRLGELAPKVAEHSVGTASLLQSIGNSIHSKNLERLAAGFKDLYQVGFQGLSCTLYDQTYQGLNLPQVESGSSFSPLLILTKGAELIKQMLLDLNSNEIKVLPSLLPELHAGRFCHGLCKDVGIIDMEWSKHIIRRLKFYSFKDQRLLFQFQKKVKVFRLRQELSKIISKKSCGIPLDFQANTMYFFDCFE